MRIIYRRKNHPTECDAIQIELSNGDEVDIWDDKEHGYGNVKVTRYQTSNDKKSLFSKGKKTKNYTHGCKDTTKWLELSNGVIHEGRKFTKVDLVLSRNIKKKGKGVK